MGLHSINHLSSLRGVYCLCATLRYSTISALRSQVPIYPWVERSNNINLVKCRAKGHKCHDRELNPCSYGHDTRWPVSDAIVSAMQYCPLRILLHMQSCPGRVRGYAKTCSVNMYMTVMCARKRACMHWTYIHAANEYPTAEHFPCHSWHALSL